MHGVEGGCKVSANEYSCTHGNQINCEDIIPNLTFDFNNILQQNKAFRISCRLTARIISSSFYKPIKERVAWADSLENSFVCGIRN
jgi:hypothetical protein